jgi:hypothetical protein
VAVGTNVYLWRDVADCYVREKLSNDTDDLLVNVGNDARRLNETLAAALPGLNLLPDEEVHAYDLPIGADLDYTGLVAIRRGNETAYAKTANRRGIAERAPPSGSDEPSAPVEAVVAERARLRREFLREVDAILKEVNIQADGSGKARNDRWIKEPAKGNAANAILAAGARALKVHLLYQLSY